MKKVKIQIMTVFILLTALLTVAQSDELYQKDVFSISLPDSLFVTNTKYICT